MDGTMEAPTVQAKSSVAKTLTNFYNSDVLVDVIYTCGDKWRLTENIPYLPCLFCLLL
ncbi:MAG: hypothetical protein KME29_14780 [Calothrix sp. FI2-JRJ7]|nr:hypothetical protein [Calothrix sp. FI2-JRJ7]